MALLLFDIDGTLLRPMGLGRSAFERALRELYGGVPSQRFPYDGMLDPQIARKTLALLGVDPPEPEVDALLALYLRHLEAERPEGKDGHLCDGFPGLLEEAAMRGHHLGLLTGNIREGARLKLGFFDLDRYFSRGGGLLGAFGEDAEVRSALVPLAVSRCEAAFGRSFAPSETWLVGDSPKDVEAAREAGVRCAAVATGSSDQASLARLGPDLALPHLGDAAPLWLGIEGAAP